MEILSLKGMGALKFPQPRLWDRPGQGVSDPLLTPLRASRRGTRGSALPLGQCGSNLRTAPMSSGTFSAVMSWLKLQSPCHNSKGQKALKIRSLSPSFPQTHLAAKPDVRANHCHCLAPWVGDTLFHCRNGSQHICLRDTALRPPGVLYNI